MPPLKNVTNKKLPATTTTVSNDKGITTRRRGLQSSVKGENLKDSYVKRKAEASPLLKKTTKRSAFGDITNANDSSSANVANGKKGSKKSTTTLVKPTTTLVKPTTTLVKPTITLVKPTITLVKSTTVTVRTTRTSSLLKTNNVVKSVKPPAPLPKVSLPMRKPSFLPPTTKPKISVKSKSDGTKQSEAPRNSTGRLSSDLERSDSSLYVSALDEILDETAPTLPPALPEPEFNIDKENWDDPFQVSIYAYDIFNYLKSRESFFVIKDYIPSQKYITAGMRTLLIDWMAEVQENFEMNHETLYLAVKLVDLYLSKVQILKMNLQLLGAASMLIAAKYDERMPPLIEDFLYICDGAYNHHDMIRMEIQVLKTNNFNLGIPLSYRFLRRYARCAKVQMPLLTLARYILEFSLMEYSTIMLSDSKMAAAALYLALKMKNAGEWSSTLHYFSGYAVDDFKDIAIQLNSILHKKPKQPVSTVRNKYSHKIFFEVAKTPLIDDCEL